MEKATKGQKNTRAVFKSSWEKMHWSMGEGGKTRVEKEVQRQLTNIRDQEKPSSARTCSLDC